MNQLFDTEPEVVVAEKKQSVDLARLLYNKLSESRRVFRKHILAKWAKELSLLLDHYSKAELEGVILWYADHWNDEYMPQAYSAKSFVDKFAAIKRAFDSQNSDQSSVTDRIMENEQRAVSRRLSLMEKLKSKGRECIIE